MEGHTVAECRIPRRYGMQGRRNAQEPAALIASSADPRS
jgi:hypothetical protein